METITTSGVPRAGSAALIIGMALIISTLIGSLTLYRTKTLGNTVSVTGSAERVVTADTVKWTAHVIRTVDVGGLRQGGFDITNDLAAVHTYVTGAGIVANQITLQPLMISPTCGGNNGYSDGKTCGSGSTIGYTLQQTMIIESSSVDLVTVLSESATSKLLSNNIVFTTDSLEYYYGKLNDLKLDLLADATTNAKTRALKIVTATGGKLGMLQSVSSGVFQITPVNSTEVSDYGSYDTTSIQKKVTVSMHAAFTLR